MGEQRESRAKVSGYRRRFLIPGKEIRIDAVTTWTRFPFASKGDPLWPNLQRPHALAPPTRRSSAGSTDWSDRSGRRLDRSLFIVRAPRGPRDGAPAAALRGSRQIYSRPGGAPLSEDPASPGKREPKTNLLPVDGVPDRPHAQRVVSSKRGAKAYSLRVMNGFVQEAPLPVDYIA